MKKKIPLFLSFWGYKCCNSTCAAHEEGEGLQISSLREASVWNSFKAMERSADPFPCKESWILVNRVKYEHRCHTIGTNGKLNLIVFDLLFW